MHIPFNRSHVVGDELQSIQKAIASGQLSGNGPFARACAASLEQACGCSRAILTPSCTDALEMCALLCDIQPGDEVIMPSYTFVSTASAFALRGARIVWCDIRPDTKNIDETLVEGLVTDRTRAVVAVHYAGVACEMDALAGICRRHGLMLIADAAQAIGCHYKGKPLAGLGDLATFSFHDTKNIHCGEGGALIVNNPSLVERAEFIRDKGTNRTQFIKGMVDKYTWVELGSSFLMSELQAAFLLPQLLNSTTINEKRLRHWARYYQALAAFVPASALPMVPEHCRHNAHMFYIMLNDLDERGRMIEYLAQAGVIAYFHYVPLHEAPYWRGKYDGLRLPVTKRTAECLLRLPMYYDLTDGQIDHVCESVRRFKAW
jgi:dTDP-4-amino-4,6-dideoxygalactose transaminase